MDAGPALVSILRQGDYLIASIHTALDDSQMLRFQHDLIDQVGRHRARGVIIDVAPLDVIDSFATSTLRNLAEMARLRGAQTVIVGIQPDVAYAMVELGMDTGTIKTALDLEEGLRLPGPRSAARTRSRPRLNRILPVSELEQAGAQLSNAFLRYLSSRDEAALHRGYQIGRAAMTGGLSLLDLAQVHHRSWSRYCVPLPTRTSTP